MNRAVGGYRQYFAVGSALIALLTGTCAAESDVAGEQELGEVVVTAQKRSEDVNKVPISVAVYDQQSMDIQGVRDISDIANLTPGVQYISTGW